MSAIHRRAWELFERYAYRSAFRRQERRLQAEMDRHLERFRQVTAGIDTPWRAGAFLEEHLREVGELRLFDVPLPGVVTWARGAGNAADYARLAQELLAPKGYEAVLLTVLRRRSIQGQVVCVVQSEEEGGWFHLSNQGMFGVYRDWDSVALDLFADWDFWLARGFDLRIQGTSRRRERQEI